MINPARRATEWLYEGVWGVLSGLFRVPREPPELPVGGGEPVAAFRLQQTQAAVQDAVVADVSGRPAGHGFCGRNSWPSPASVRSCRASCSDASSTRIRRGSMPIEPSSTLMFWSSTM